MAYNYEPDFSPSNLNDYIFEDNSISSSGGISLHSTSGWQPDEDFSVVYIWSHYSNDSIRGNDQSSKDFWQKIMMSYNQKHPQKTRSATAISGRFQKISRQTQHFASQVHKIKEANPSGIGGEEDLRKRANTAFKETFKPENKHQPHFFQFMHCYDLLSTHPKWNSENSKTVEAIQSKNKGKQKAQRGNYSSSPGGSPNSDAQEMSQGKEDELTDLNLGEDFRPMGVKAAKKKNLKHANRDAILAASRERYAKEAEDKLADSKERTAVMRRFADIEDEKLKLDREIHDRAQIHQDMLIMNMDLSSMDDATRGYYNGLKRMIIARQARQGF